MRTLDNTKVVCKICKYTGTVYSFRSHLRMHAGYNTEKYVEEFGEFRPKKINEAKSDLDGGVVCKECNVKFKSHKKLMHHIKTHDMTYIDYHVKHTFNGSHPVCKCGCGESVKILKGGITINGRRYYARDFKSGHNTSMQVGVQTRTIESRMKMRQSAINRMEREGRRYSPKTPNAQLEILEYVNSISRQGVFEMNDTTVLHGREIDIVNHTTKLAIEYNGLYFHSDKFRDRNYHVSKLNETINFGYKLIYIWEDWWIRKKDIVKSILLTKLGEPSKIYARKCEVREITDQEARIFLRKTHLQGGCVSSVRLGLFYYGELISVMTFGKLRKATGKTHIDANWELLRFSSKLNTTVIGGASKLFSYFVSNYNPHFVLSYANRDWSTGDMYYKLGFVNDGITAPGYFYAKGKRRFARFAFTKAKLVKNGADKMKSEAQIMDEAGYLKIWNTGNFRFIWKSPHIYSI